MKRFVLHILMMTLLLGPAMAPVGVHASMDMGDHAPTMHDCLKHCFEVMQAQAQEQAVLGKVLVLESEATVSFHVSVPRDGHLVTADAFDQSDPRQILTTQKRE